MEDRDFVYEARISIRTARELSDDELGVLSYALHEAASGIRDAIDVYARVETHGPDAVLV